MFSVKQRNSWSAKAGIMSLNGKSTAKIDVILPDFGKLFYEQKRDLVFCKPHLMPLKSITLEKLETMQKQAHEQLRETRAKTAATNQL